MKKLLKSMVIVLFLLMLAVNVNATEVFIDGQKVPYTQESGFPFVQDGRTLVPLRATMEAFGASVDWDSSTHTAIVSHGTTTVRCKIGSDSITRNNVIIPNDAPALESNGRTYLPIRVVLEAFGASVLWDGNVNVTGKGSLISDIENTPSVTTNYWGKWNNALTEKSNGNYQAAIDGIRSIANIFLSKNLPDSNAMLFKHLGECYAELNQYDNASQCFKRESYYWNLADMRDSRIDAERRSKLISSTTQIYVKTDDLSDGAKSYFGVPNEPIGTTLLGAYAEGDPGIYSPYDPSRFYMDTFPQLVERDISAYLLYLPFGQDISIYDSHISEAIEKNKVLEIALDPHNGLNAVSNANGYITTLARNMQSKGCKFLLRFASEINDTTGVWHTSDYNLFIEKFRLVSSIFKKEAPNVAIIWSVNHFPEDTIPLYYPGDEYVDYVGISSYAMHQPVTDPYNQGVDRNRWSNQLDKFYALYGHKKPIIIVEGGSSYMDYDTYADITEFASTQLYDFYTYLPIKYPNIKYSFIFDSDRERHKFSLSNNYTYLSAYRNAIKSPLYGLNINDPHTYHYYELGNNVPVKATSTTLTSYITTPKNNISYVNYYINDVFIGTSNAIPYECNFDFSWYKDQQVKVTAKAYDSQNIQLTDYSTFITVN